VPVFLSEIPELFKRGILPLDAAIVSVSPPDRHGYCSLGTSVDIARAAVNAAKCVIAQVNSNIPRTHGDGMIHISRFSAMVEAAHPLPEVRFDSDTGVAEKKIGEIIAGLVDDRSCIQMGIGAIPDAVLKSLGNHKDLGVHTEMFSDGLLDLIEKGVVSNRYKKIHPHKTVSGFALGTRRLYDFVDDNPAFAFLDIDYVNDPSVIKRNSQVIAINSAIEVDLTGQVCADYPGRFAFKGRQADYRANLPHPKRHSAYRTHAQTRRGGGHDPGACPLCRDGIRSGQSFWAKSSAARLGTASYCPSRRPGGPGARGTRAVWRVRIITTWPRGTAVYQIITGPP
jgi:hypothetical protein